MPKFVSVSAFAQKVGASDAAVRHAQRHGRLRDAVRPDGTMELEVALSLWGARRNRPGPGRNADRSKLTEPPPVGDDDYDGDAGEDVHVASAAAGSLIVWQTLHEKEKALERGLKRRALEGELVHRATVERRLGNLLTAERDGWVQWVFDVAPKLAEALGIEVTGLERELEQAVRQKLSTLTAAMLASPPARAA